MSAPPTSDLRAGPKQWTGLAVLAPPTILLALDMSVLYLALPHLAADLRPSGTQALWIIDVYGFMIAGLLITMGGLGDRIGRRRLLLAGAAAFGLASLLAAYSSSPEMLIAARTLLGIAGATLMPSTLSLISNMFADPKQRGLAIGVWMISFNGGIIIGPIVGGVLLERFWWGSVFLLAVPVMALLLVAGPILLPEFRESRPGRLDPASVILSLAAVLPPIYGIKQLAKDGFGPLPIVAIAAGMLLAVAFARRQRALADPLLDLGLFKNRAFSAAVAIMLLVLITTGGIFLLITQYLQIVEGLSPLEAGIRLLPQGVGMVLASLIAPVLARRIRPAYVIAGGLALTAAGYLMVTQAGGAHGPAFAVTGLVVIFFGAMPLLVLGTDLIVGSAPPDRAGSASAVSETSTELGVALGVAIMGSVGAAIYRGRMSDSVPDDAPPQAAEIARDSLEGAASVAGQLPAGTLDAARDAFTAGLSTVGAISALAVAVLSGLTLATLRHVRPSSSVAGATEEA